MNATANSAQSVNASNGPLEFLSFTLGKEEYGI